jgi:hypothetical protein
LPVRRVAGACTRVCLGYLERVAPLSQARNCVPSTGSPLVVPERIMRSGTSHPVLSGPGNVPCSIQPLHGPWDQGRQFALAGRRVEVASTQPEPSTGLPPSHDATRPPGSGSSHPGRFHRGPCQAHAVRAGTRRFRLLMVWVKDRSPPPRPPKTPVLVSGRIHRQSWGNCSLSSQWAPQGTDVVSVPHQGTGETNPSLWPGSTQPQSQDNPFRFSLSPPAHRSLLASFRHSLDSPVTVHHARASR